MNITLEEYLKHIQEQEQATKEPDEVTEMFKKNAEAVINLSEQPKVKICSDYDCDGLTSAYIMRQTLLSLNPDMQIEVEPNDRRGSYGINDKIENADNTPHIILDMGSNQLDLLDKNVGEGCYIVIDHHLIEDKETLEKFKNNNDGSLCNPHCFNEDDSLNAQYCTAGLAYRIYEECKNMCKELGKPFHTSEKQENTLVAVSAIGTATDVVNVLDVHSNNRDILKRGIEAIDNATKDNFDLKIGCMLTMNKISEQTTATQLAFNTGSFINSTSRMSEVMEMNGAKKFFDVMTNDNFKGYSFARELEYLQEMNLLRKEITDKVYQTEQFKNFVKEHTTGEKVTDNIGVFVIPKDIEVPHNLAGLISNKLSESTDKSIIVLTQTKNGDYAGSGRGGSSIATSLYDFVKEVAQENNLSMTFGGHKQAIGISKLPKEEIDTFLAGIEKNLDKIKTVSVADRNILPISEFLKEDSYELLNKCEPLGHGNKLPCVKCEGKEVYRNSGFKRKNGVERPDWKDVKFNVSVDVKMEDENGKAISKKKSERLSAVDWSYSPEKYLADDKGNISFVAELSVNTFKGDGSLQLTAKFDRLQYIERAKELGISFEKADKTDDGKNEQNTNITDDFDEFDI